MSSFLNCAEARAFAESRNYHVYWCHNFKEGDYSEIWLVAFLVILINLGIMFFAYFKISAIVRVFKQTAEEGNIQENITRNIAARQNQSNPELAGFSFNFYTFHSAIISGIYFAAKVALITNSTLKPVNGEFKNLSFHNWCTAENLIILALFTNSVSTSRQVLKEIFQVTISGTIALPYDPTIMFISTLILTTDVIGSFVLICVKYGYLVLILYLSAVGLVAGIGLAVSFFCWAPCLFGVLYITLLGAKLDGNTGCGRIFYPFVGSAVLYAFIYVIFAMVLALMWSFINGPAHSVILFSSQSSDFIIFCLIVAAAGYGLIAGLLNMVFTCTKSEVAVVNNSNNNNIGTSV